MSQIQAVLVERRFRVAATRSTRLARGAYRPLGLYRDWPRGWHVGHPIIAKRSAADGGSRRLGSCLTVRAG